jgi:hypothetical protein
MFLGTPLHVRRRRRGFLCPADLDRRGEARLPAIAVTTRSAKYLLDRLLGGCISTIQHQGVKFVFGCLLVRTEPMAYTINLYTTAVVFRALGT